MPKERITVLLFADHEPLAWKLAGELEKSGAVIRKEVSTVADVVNALLSGTYNILILAGSPKKATGTTLLKKLQAIGFQHIPLLFLSPLPPPNLLEIQDRFPFADHCPWPAEPQSILFRIKVLLKTRAAAPDPAGKETKNSPPRAEGLESILNTRTAQLVNELAENLKLRAKQTGFFSDPDHHDQFISTLLESIPLPVYFKDPAGRYLICNHAFARFMGREKKDILGFTLFDLIDSTQAGQIRAREKAMLGGDGTMDSVEEFRHTDGSLRIVRVIKKLIGLNKGVSGQIGVVWDITESKHHEKYLKTQYLIDYLSSIPKGIKPAMRQIMKLVFDFEWVDAGGIYLFEEDKKWLSLTAYQGLTPEQAVLLNRYDAESDQMKLLLEKTPRYGNFEDILKTADVPGFMDQIRSVAIIPLIDRMNDEVIGSLNLASKNYTTSTEKDRLNFETIAARIVFLINYARAQAALKRSQKVLQDEVRTRTAELRMANRRLKQEIALQRITSRALNRSEHIYRGIFDHSHDGIILFDGDNLEVVDMNNRANLLLGYTKEEFMQLGAEAFAVLAGPREKTGLLNELSRMGTATFPVSYRSTVRSPLHHILYLKQLKVNRKKYFLGILHDITPVVEKERVILDTESRIREIQDNLPIGIFTSTPDGRIIYANRFLRQMFGYGSIHDFNRLEVINFYAKPADREKTIQELMTTGAVYNREQLLVTRTGKKIWTRTNIRTKKDEEGHPVQFDATLENISKEIADRNKLKKANKLVEKMIHNLKQEVKDALSKHNRQQSLLVQKSKLESLGELAAGIAHEINQPLGIMALSFENLQQKIKDGDSSLEYLNTKFRSIENNIRRIRDIIDHIRIFSRDQDLPTLDKVNVNKVVGKALLLIGAQYRNHGVQLELDLKDQIGFTVGSNLKFEQAVLNILSNAKYAVDERAIDHHEGDFLKTITVTTRNDSKTIQLSIRDNGIGIKKEHLSRIFDPFFTTKSEGQGTGLGLSIVYGIIKDMRGDIKVRSQVGEYTIFDIFLPRYPEKL